MGISIQKCLPGTLAKVPCCIPLNCMSVSAYMSIWAPCVCIAHRGQKVVLDRLELELQVIVNCYMVFQNWTWIIYKSSLFSYCQATSTAIFLAHEIRWIWSTDIFLDKFVYVSLSATLYVCDCVCVGAQVCMGVCRHEHIETRSQS